MAGPEATDVAGDPVPTAPDDVARVEVQHWREVATAREAALRSLTRRPLVRIAVGIDRQVAPLGRRLSGWRAHARARVDQAALAVAGRRARVHRARRGAALAQEVARLGPVPLAPSVSVITFEPWADDGWQGPLGTAPQVVDARSSSAPDQLMGGRSRTAALSRAARTATGDVLCFVPDAVEAPAPGWLARLACGIDADVVATTPTLLHPDRDRTLATEHDLLVRAEGFDLALAATGAPLLTARSAGTAPNVRRDPADVPAAPLRCLAVDRVAYLAAGGLRAADADDAAAVDLCARLRARGGRVRHLPQALAFDDRPIPSRRALREPLAAEDPAWRWLVEHDGPALAHAARGRDDAAPRWAITTAAPSAAMAERWGDWHLAQALATSLRRLGIQVQVQTADQADAPATRSQDLHLVLHGLAPVRRSPGQRHVLWVISHPETLDLADCDDADLVLVASARFAAHLRTQTSTPVEVLLQATDGDRFEPRPVDRAHQHQVTVVAKTREVLRPIVADAVAAGLRPAIYGSGWRELVDPALVVADHVDNARLPVVYSSAGVVLNDHWDTMRAWGFVSNRLFDVLACGAPVVSDHLPEIHDLFGASVTTYRTVDELGELVRGILDDPDAARAKATAGRALVLAAHTFDHRAQQLLDLLELHDDPRDPARMEQAQ